MVKPAWLITMAKALWPLVTLPKKSRTIARIINLLGDHKIVELFINSRILASMPVLKDVSESYIIDDHIVYSLPNEEVITINETIKKPPDTILPTQILDNIIDKAEHFYILNVCFCRYLDNCKDYPIDVGCLFVGESVLSIEPSHIGRHVSREEARAHVKKVRDLGLVSMISKVFIEVAFLEVDDYDKVMMVCHCCPCCCTLGQFEYFPKEIGKVYRRLPGVIVKVDKDKCVGCKTCTKDVCFINAIHFIKSKAIIDQNYCKACGRCIDACPKKAISITFNDDEYAKKAMREIEKRLELY